MHPNISQQDPCKAVVVNGKLRLPLYHGTSSIWVESIMQSGLGARNVVEEFQVLEILRELIGAYQEHGIKENPGYLLSSAQRIANQFVSSSDRGWNYRHGSVYLCASPMKPAMHALAFPTGSEAIEYSVKLYQNAVRERPEEIRQISEKIAVMLSVVSREAEPIVIEVRDIPIELLRSEHGRSADSVLGFLQEIVESVSSDLSNLGQAIIFEVPGSIPPEHLTAYRVGSNYEYGRTHVPLIPYALTKVGDSQ